MARTVRKYKHWIPFSEEFYFEMTRKDKIARTNPIGERGSPWDEVWGINGKRIVKRDTRRWKRRMGKGEISVQAD